MTVLPDLCRAEGSRKAVPPSLTITGLACYTYSRENNFSKGFCHGKTKYYSFFAKGFTEKGKGGSGGKRHVFERFSQEDTGVASDAGKSLQGSRATAIDVAEARIRPWNEWTMGLFSGRFA